MITAVISDIHGNLEAFEQVAADIDRTDAQQIICLGDCIGYGPQPEEVLRAIQARRIPTLLGNHEQAARNQDHLKWFNPKARQSLEIILSLLSPSSLEFIRTLPASMILDQCRFVHGYPPDSVRTYLFQKTDLDLRATFARMSEQICFVGHTHDLQLIEFNGRQVHRYQLAQHMVLDPSHRYIINVGSVGQPRDGTNAAKYVLWHQQEQVIELRAVAYDIEAVVHKILAAGLPPENAARLW